MNYGNGAGSTRLIDTFYSRDSSGALLADISAVGITAFNRGAVFFKDTLLPVYTRIAETTALPIVVAATSSISAPASDPTFSKVINDSRTDTSKYCLSCVRVPHGSLIHTCSALQLFNTTISAYRSI
jgi:hypothetical protein